MTRTTIITAALLLSISNGNAADSNGNDIRPSKWCGWQMRQWLGVADKAFNRAIAWKKYGSPASSDCVNCIAVFPHHVGIVTGRPAPGRIILKSGNDGGKVRERERSARGVVAYRYQAGSVVSENVSTIPGVMR